MDSERIKLQGKRALVTGGATGIGLACARGLASLGSNLSIADRDVEPLKAATRELRTSFGVEVSSHSCDIGRSDHQRALVDVVGPVDVLVNAAGDFPGGSLLEVEDDTWRSAWDTKVNSTVNLCRLIIGSMIERQRGVIVNILGNPLAEMPEDGLETSRPSGSGRRIAGAVGNHAVAEFSRVLGSASAESGVRVIAVDPGPTITDGLVERLADQAERRLGDRRRWLDMVATEPLPNKPDDVARVVSFLVTDDATTVSGSVVELSPSRLKS